MQPSLFSKKSVSISAQRGHLSGKKEVVRRLSRCAHSRTTFAWHRYRRLSKKSGIGDPRRGNSRSVFDRPVRKKRQSSISHPTHEHAQPRSPVVEGLVRMTRCDVLSTSGNVSPPTVTEHNPTVCSALTSVAGLPHSVHGPAYLDNRSKSSEVP